MGGLLQGVGYRPYGAQAERIGVQGAYRGKSHADQSVRAV